MKDNEKLDLSVVFAAMPLVGKTLLSHLQKEQVNSGGERQR